MEKISKKLIITFTTLVLASGCGFFGDAKPFQPDFEGKIQQTAEYSIFLPTAWTVLEKMDNLPPETIAAFQTPEKTAGILQSITITKSSLDDDIESTTLMENQLALHKKTLENFTNIAEQKIKLVNNGENDRTLLLYFSGKPSAASPNNFKFLQTGLIQEKTAYVITATISDQEKDTNIQIIEQILKSFLLKEMPTVETSTENQ